MNAVCDDLLLFVESTLEAYKTGPIRTIARVIFNYKFLKLNFDLGMYTEVSFFSNAVILPATIDNPFEGKKSLNKNSTFYYGMAIDDNPNDLAINTNVPPFEESGFLDLFKSKPKVESLYRLQAHSKDYMFLLQMTPSRQMKRSGNVPQVYIEKKSGKEVLTRPKSAAPLGSSPVNMAMGFDLFGLDQGIHQVDLRLYVENRTSDKILKEFQELHQWKIKSKRMTLSNKL